MGLIPGTPHRLMEDDVYKGRFIPAGTTVMDNTWYATRFLETILLTSWALRRAIFRDESVYPNAHIFNPNRFLKDGQINPDVKDPERLTFGYGRRYVHPQ